MSKKKKGAGISEKLALSPALQRVVGKGPMSRPEVVKKIWNYIKKNDLQHPKHRQWVEIDEVLEEIFSPTRKAYRGVKPAGCIVMFDIASQLSKHMGKADGKKVKKNPVDDYDYEEDEELDEDDEDEDEYEDDEDYDDDDYDDEEDD
jgi:chromatin remodeling complex protein RSC6